MSESHKVHYIGCTRPLYYILESLYNLRVRNHLGFGWTFLFMSRLYTVTLIKSQEHQGFQVFFAPGTYKDGNWGRSHGETGTHTRSVIIYSTESPFITSSSVYPHHNVYTNIQNVHENKCFIKCTIKYNLRKKLDTSFNKIVTIRYLHLSINIKHYYYH